PGQRHDWFLGIWGSGRSRNRLRRINHGKVLARSLHSSSAIGEAKARKHCQLKNTFPDGHGIARLDKKTPAASLREALRIHLENLIATRVMSPHRNSFRRSNAGISASQLDGLEEITTARAGIRH